MFRRKITPKTMRKQINDSFHNNEPTCWQVWDFIWFRNISDIMNWVCLFYCTRQRHKRSKNKALCVSFRYHGLQTYSITLPRWISNSIKKRPTIYDTVAIHAMLFTWGTARHSVENMECLVCLRTSHSELWTLKAESSMSLPFKQEGQSPVLYPPGPTHCPLP